MSPAPAKRSRAVHSVSSVVRVGTSLGVVALVVLAVTFASSAIAGIEADLLRLTADLPDSVVELLVRLVQLLTVVAPVAALVALLALRRFRRILAMAVAGVAGGVLSRVVMVNFLDLTVERFRVTGAISPGTPFPSAPLLAALAAMIAADAPWMGHRWRRAAQGSLVLLLTLRAFSGKTGLRELVVALAVGWVVGAVTVALVGAPDRRPRKVAVVAALTRLGVSVGEIRDGRSIGGRHHFEVLTKGGQELWVEVAARDGWQTMLPGRLYRALRFRDPADGRPFAGLRETTEHEALVALKALGDGVPTLVVEAIGGVEPDGYLLAFRAIDAESAHRSEQLTEDDLPELWSIVAKLRSARVAHRGLNDTVILREQGTGALNVVGFDAAELTGDERILIGDVAEVLSWTAKRWGVEAAVTTSIKALGPGVVARALPRLQPLALTRHTRAEIDEELLSAIGASIRNHTGATDTSLAPVERIKPRKVLQVVMAIIALNALIPQFAGAGKVWEELRHASVVAAVLALLLSLLPYLGAALALGGSVAEPLPFGPNLAVQIAANFTAIAAPAQVGTMALKGRFLQRRGIPNAVSVAAIGLNTVAAFVVHILVTAVFVYWAGSSDLSAIRLPSSRTIWLVLGGVVAAVAVMAALPFARKFARESLLPAVRRSIQGVVDVATSPIRLLGLISGSLIVTLGYLFAMVASVAAFNSDLPVAAVALVYLVGAVVQSVAPTPGGLGPAEAAYIGGLTALGLASERAVAAVLLFRLVTFWLPVLPGWIAMTWLQRSDAL